MGGRSRQPSALQSTISGSPVDRPDTIVPAKSPSAASAIDAVRRSCSIITTSQGLGSHRKTGPSEKTPSGGRRRIITRTSAFPGVLLTMDCRSGQAKKPCIGMRQGVTANSSLQQTIDRDGKIAHALSRRMVYGVRDGGSHGNRADFAKALHADRADLVVGFVDENHIDIIDIGV